MGNSASNYSSQEQSNKKNASNSSEATILSTNVLSKIIKTITSVMMKLIVSLIAFGMVLFILSGYGEEEEESKKNVICDKMINENNSGYDDEAETVVGDRKKRNRDCVDSLSACQLEEIYNPTQKGRAGTVNRDSTTRESDAVESSTQRQFDDISSSIYGEEVEKIEEKPKTRKRDKCINIATNWLKGDKTAVQDITASFTEGEPKVCESDHVEDPCSPRLETINSCSHGDEIKRVEEDPSASRRDEWENKATNLWNGTKSAVLDIKAKVAERKPKVPDVGCVEDLYTPQSEAVNNFGCGDTFEKAEKVLKVDESVYVEKPNLLQLETANTSNRDEQQRRKINRERLNNYNRMLAEKKNYVCKGTAETVKQTSGTHTISCIKSFTTRSLKNIKNAVCEDRAQTVEGTPTKGGNINITPVQWEEVMKGAYGASTQIFTEEPTIHTVECIKLISARKVDELKNYVSNNKAQDSTLDGWEKIKKANQEARVLPVEKKPTLHTVECIKMISARKINELKNYVSNKKAQDSTLDGWEKIKKTNEARALPVDEHVAAGKVECLKRAMLDRWNGPKNAVHGKKAQKPTLDGWGKMAKTDADLKVLPVKRKPPTRKRDRIKTLPTCFITKCSGIQLSAVDLFNNIDAKRRQTKAEFEDRAKERTVKVMLKMMTCMIKMVFSVTMTSLRYFF